MFVLPPRRKIVSHHRKPFLREEFESSSVATVSNMDETALRARKRLEQKFSCLYSNIRPWKHHQLDEDRGSSHWAPAEEKTWLGSKLLMRLWHHQLLSRWYDSARETCPVCLEDIQAQQKVMDLSCSHKFHSSCLIPWLEADHPHCPCCRTPVHS